MEAGLVVVVVVGVTERRQPWGRSASLEVPR